jgi:hypothetical protein
MSKKMKVPDLYDTYDFYEVKNNKLDYKIVSKKDKKMCGWIRKFCIDKSKVKKEKE